MSHSRSPRTERQGFRPLAADHALVKILGTIVVLSLIGCAAVGPDYIPPEMDTPPAYVAEMEGGLSDDRGELGEWWLRLGDEELGALAERAVASNLDLKAALQRITEARAVYGIVRADLVPTIDTNLDVSRSQASREEPFGAFGPRTIENFRIGLDAGWEIDLWGRIRRSVEAAGADIDATVENARDVLVSILADTALTYVDLRTAQERARIARSNVDLQSRTLQLTQDRFRAGIVSELDVAQATSILETTTSTLPPLEATARLARNRLAILLGLAPGALEEELLAPQPIPLPPQDIAVGIPADVIRRRPDVRRAERELAAATARIGVSEAELYPRLSLLGSIGLSAAQFKDLRRSNAAEFSFGPSLTWNVFDRQRLLGAVAAQEARTEQALLVYESVVLRALDEVEGAMTTFVRSQARRRALERAVEASRKAVELSREQYRQGLVSFQSVLDTQLRLFAVEDELALNQAEITSSVIFVYRALGGGWESRDVVLVPASEDDEVEEGK